MHPSRHWGEVVTVGIRVLGLRRENLKNIINSSETMYKQLNFQQ
jgi:hypothetical protein